MQTPVGALFLVDQNIKPKKISKSTSEIWAASSASPPGNRAFTYSGYFLFVAFNIPHVHSRQCLLYMRMAVSKKRMTRSLIHAMKSTGSFVKLLVKILFVLLRQHQYQFFIAHQNVKKNTGISVIKVSAPLLKKSRFTTAQS